MQREGDRGEREADRVVRASAGVTVGEHSLTVGHRTRSKGVSDTDRRPNGLHIEPASTRVQIVGHGVFNDALARWAGRPVGQDRRSVEGVAFANVAGEFVEPGRGAEVVAGVCQRAIARISHRLLAWCAATPADGVGNYDK